MDWSLEKILAVIGAIGIPAGIGVGVAMDTKTIGELRFAQACFITAAVVAMVFIAIWGVTMDGSFSRRLLFVVLLYSASGLGLVESIRWSQARHEAAHKTPSDPSAPAQSEPSTAPSSPSTAPLVPEQSRAALPQMSKPHPIEIAAKFIEGTSPGVVLFSPNHAVIRQPTCTVQMWNLNRTPLGSLPTFHQSEQTLFIKPNSGLLLATLDNPSMRPNISVGDRVFGYVSVDCPECKESRSYWLYVIYGQPSDSWSSEIPKEYKMNPLVVNQMLNSVGGDVEKFMSLVPHGEAIHPGKE